MDDNKMFPNITDPWSLTEVTEVETEETEEGTKEAVKTQEPEEVTTGNILRDNQMPLTAEEEEEEIEETEEETEETEVVQTDPLKYIKHKTKRTCTQYENVGWRRFVVAPKTPQKFNLINCLNLCVINY